MKNLDVCILMKFRAESTQEASFAGEYYAQHPKQPVKINDKYMQIEFVKPKKNEIGYLYIDKAIVNWVDGKAHSTTKTTIQHKHPLSLSDGIDIATKYMMAHPEGQ